MAKFDEVLFAAGYPHMVRFVDDQRDPAKLAASAIGSYEPTMGVDWPRATAIRYVRGRADLGTNEEIDEATGRRILAALLGPRVNDSAWHGSRAVYILEHLIGADAVVDAVLAHFERTPTDRWDLGTLGGAIVYSLGFVALRMPATTRATLYERMQTLAAKGARSQDTGVHGRAARFRVRRHRCRQA